MKKHNFKATAKEGFMTIPQSLWQYKYNDDFKFDVGLQLIYKENGSRHFEGLARGEFKYTLNTLLKDLEHLGVKHSVNINKSKINRIIKEFIEIGFISVAEKGSLKDNSPTVYRINKIYVENETSAETICETIKYNNSNSCTKLDETMNESIDATSKKELSKRIIKNFVLLGEVQDMLDKYNTLFLIKEKLDNQRLSELNNLYNQNKEIFEYTLKQISMTSHKKHYNYLIGIYKNQLSQQNYKSTKPMGRIDSNYKTSNNIITPTKFHNFKETFIQYSEEELDEIIEKSQRSKFGNLK